MKKIIVIKLGGSIMDALPQSFYDNIKTLHQSQDWTPIIVHGGGPLITKLSTALDLQTQFIDGLRVTDEAVLDVVEMALSGSANKKIVCELIKTGVKAVGISGVDGLLLQARQIADTRLGFVGEIETVNHSLLDTLINQGYMPVISPIGIDQNGQRYNINGDTATSAVAKALSAHLCFVSDIDGIYVEKDGQKTLLNHLNKAEVEQLIAQGDIYGGMIPKVKSALDGLSHGVAKVAIVNGTAKDSLLRYCVGEQVGTTITLD